MSATLAMAMSAHAESTAAPVQIDIDKSRLFDALLALGSQANITIALDAPMLGDTPVHPVHGKLRPRAALQRMFRGTGLVARMVAPGAYRVVQARPSSRPTRHEMAIRAAGEIIVSGSKRDLQLKAYPGSAIVTDVRTLPLARVSHGSDALVSEQPLLSSTHLGPGRNKLFIRGIADSSFNGPSQSTVGQYLGDARLTFNAPDPDLPLYDIAAAEVLEGPQGTLYGAGALGGIVRLVPVMPNLSTSNLGVSLGGAATRHGAMSYDVAALANLPIVTGVAGIRLLAYQIQDGGYIDDPGRNLRDINRTRTWGGRLEARFVPAPDWTLDLTGMVHNIASRDGNYADRGRPRLQRTSVVAQPFDNDYALAGITLRRNFGQFSLTSTTSIVRHNVEYQYDASPSPTQPRLFQEQDHITLLTNETRLAHQASDGSNWVIGMGSAPQPR